MIQYELDEELVTALAEQATHLASTQLESKLQALLERAEAEGNQLDVEIDLEGVATLSAVTPDATMRVKVSVSLVENNEPEVNGPASGTSKE